MTLDAAYSLKTPEDSRKLYAAWAATYDSDFAEKMDYQLPFAVAEAFVTLGGQGPVLDVGAGTGLAGHALRAQGIAAVDGTDISAEMLAVAAARDRYARTFVADITSGLPVADGHYSGAISSGTFTLGHVGPEALAEVLRVVAPGGLAVISVSRAHFEAAGFDLVLPKLAPVAQISQIEVPIYGPDHAGARAGETAVLICARRS